MREQALILRLVAAELTGEERSVFVLRHTLADLGWEDAQVNAAVAHVRKAIVGLYRQSQLFEKAA